MPDLERTRHDLCETAESVSSAQKGSPKTFMGSNKLSSLHRNLTVRLCPTFDYIPGSVSSLMTTPGS
jgi:hypothetical protein